MNPLKSPLGSVGLFCSLKRKEKSEADHLAQLTCPKNPPSRSYDLRICHLLVGAVIPVLSWLDALNIIAPKYC